MGTEAFTLTRTRPLSKTVSRMLELTLKIICFFLQDSPWRQAYSGIGTTNGVNGFGDKGTPKKKKGSSL
jgi:hypothetical protein